MSDLISRQAAIKTIDDLPNCYNGHSDTYDKAYIIGTLEELPSAQPEPQWIPCSERLPEEEDMYKRPQNRYICQMNQAGIFLMLARLRHLGSPMAAFWDWYGKNVPDKDVVAWMPLPEPYEEEDA